MKDYELYIFDFDNTMFDTSIGLAAILNNAFPPVGLQYDESMFQDLVGMTMEQIFDKFVGDESKRDIFYEKFREVVHSDAYLKGAPFPDTKETFEELMRRGKRIAIASGKFRFKILKLMEVHGMAHLIPEVVIGYHDTERHKPDPDPILKAMSYFDLPEETIVYVGDSPHDALAARNAGVDSVIVNRHNGLTPDGIECTWEISSLKELLV